MAEEFELLRVPTPQEIRSLMNMMNTTNLPPHEAIAEATRRMKEILSPLPGGGDDDSADDSKPE